jgi:hypothetical protein
MMHIFNLICPRPSLKIDENESKNDEDENKFTYKSNIKNKKTDKNSKIHIISEYGPPKYALSNSSWSLLILSRRSLEVIITLLNLDISFYNEEII